MNDITPFHDAWPERFSPQVIEAMNDLNKVTRGDILKALDQPRRLTETDPISERLIAEGHPPRLSRPGLY